MIQPMPLPTQFNAPPWALIRLGQPELDGTRSSGELRATRFWHINDVVELLYQP